MKSHNVRICAEISDGSLGKLLFHKKRNKMRGELCEWWGEQRPGRGKSKCEVHHDLETAWISVLSTVR